MEKAVKKLAVIILLTCFIVPSAKAGEGSSNAASVLSRYNVNLYGRIQLDIIYDDSSSYPGPYVLYGLSEEIHHDDNRLYMTANSSRLGLSFAGPESGGRSLSGVVEVDFQGDPENDEPDLLLRHAYLLYNAGGGWEMLAGQTWDLISPLQPPLLNWAPGWGWGNIGFWHPQLRLTYRRSPVEIAFAVSKPHGGDIDGGGVDDGQDVGWPNLQGRIGFRFSDKFAFGFSGHYGGQEIDYMEQGERYVNTWSANFDLMFPVKDLMMVTGEFFIGQNLDGYMGGVLQGIHIYTDSKGEIVREGYQATGGWLNFGFGKNQWELNLGGSIDDVHDYRLYWGTRTPGDFGDRTQNMVFWANFLYEIYPNLKAGFEFSHSETLYQNTRKGEPNRSHIAVIYEF